MKRNPRLESLNIPHATYLLETSYLLQILTNGTQQQKDLIQSEIDRMHQHELPIFYSVLYPETWNKNNDILKYQKNLK